MFLKLLKILSSRRISTISMLVIIASLLFTIYSQWNEIAAIEWEVSFSYLALSLLFHTLALFSTFLLWHWILRTLGGFVTWRTDFYLYFVTTLAKRMPTNIPHIGSRLLMYRENGVPTSTTVASTTYENIALSTGGLLSLVLLLPFYSIAELRLVATYCLPVIFLCMLLFVLKPSLVTDLIRVIMKFFGSEVHLAPPQLRAITLWSASYSSAWFFAGLSLYFLLYGLLPTLSISPVDAIGISSVATLAAIINFFLPISTGLKEVALTTLLLPWLPLPIAFSISIVYRLFHTLNELAWSAVASTSHSFGVETLAK